MIKDSYLPHKFSLYEASRLLDVPVTTLEGLDRSGYLKRDDKKEYSIGQLIFGKMIVECTNRLGKSSATPFAKCFGKSFQYSEIFQQNKLLVVFTNIGAMELPVNEDNISLLDEFFTPNDKLVFLMNEFNDQDIKELKSWGFFETAKLDQVLIVPVYRIRNYLIGRINSKLYQYDAVEAS
ncbi:MAG: hypothetical protein AB4063_19725 [Crocosphaera sp.]